jgi:hypothetical protein
MCLMACASLNSFYLHSNDERELFVIESRFECIYFGFN